jgi:hypothetical protein
MHERWTADNLAVADARKAQLVRYAVPLIGKRPLGSVRPSDIRAILDTAHDAGLGRQSVIHVRNGLNAIFGPAWGEQGIASNPVEPIHVPDYQ